LAQVPRPTRSLAQSWRARAFACPEAMAVPSDLRAKGIQRSSKALTLVALIAAVAALHSCAPVLGFVGLAPVSSGLRSVLPTRRATLLARAAKADGEDGDAATRKKQKTQQKPGAARERLLEVLDEKKLAATGDVIYSVYEQLDDADSTPTFTNTSRYIGKVAILGSDGKSRFFVGNPRVDLDASKESAAKAALSSLWLTDKMETKSEPKKAMEKAVREPKQAPEKEVRAAALKQQRIEATQTSVAAMPDVKAEDLEVGQVVKGIFRQSSEFGQVVSLGKELSGILLWIEAAEDGKRQEAFRAGVEQEFRVLAKTTALGDGLPVLLTARSGDLTRPPSMVEDNLFALPQEASSKKQDLSEFAGISPETWLEATVVNTAMRRMSRPSRVVVTLTAPGGSKKVVQAVFWKAIQGPVSFGSKLKVRASEVNLAKSRLGLTMLEKTPEETKA